jgi:hypothetical protein
MAVISTTNLTAEEASMIDITNRKVKMMQDKLQDLQVQLLAFETAALAAKSVTVPQGATVDFVKNPDGTATLTVSQ